MSAPLEQIDFHALLDHPGAQLWKARRHLLDTRDLTRTEVDCLLALAASCKKFHLEGTAGTDLLAGRIVANLFYENSTRTRSSFELAARKLGASVLNLDISTSSVAKGETITDTAQTLVSMGVSAVVQRHPSSGSAHQLADALEHAVHVINAGDGWNAHPTQALLDLFSMREVMPDLKGARVAIVGDIMHSRVARSNIWLLKLYGADVHVAGPPTLIPRGMSGLAVTVHNRIEPAIEASDFIICLRLQLERMKQGLIPSAGEYKRLYRLDHQRMKLARKGARVLHPGPVNRGIEITDALASDSLCSLINQQVTNGIAVRMAALLLLLHHQEHRS